MYKQLQYDERLLIQIYLEDPENHSLNELAKTLRRSKSSIYREIILNSEKTKNKYMSTSKKTIQFYPCARLKKWPYVCNNCANVKCPKDKRNYIAYSAHYLAKLNKKTASSKLRIDSKKKLAIVEEKLIPFLQKKISVEVACAKTNCDVSPNTIRYWINTQRLSIRRIDMPRAAKYFNKKVYKKESSINSIPARILYSRTMTKYLEYTRKNKCNIVQLDTVIGKITDKYSVLTIYDLNTKFQFGFKIRNNAESLNIAVLKLWDLFERVGINIDVILTDNGIPMQRLPEIEVNEYGVVRFKTFYCDPYCSNQKPDCERNHVLVRYGLKKGESIDAISQTEIIDIFSQVNSYPRKSLGWKTPFEAFSSKYPNGRDLLESLGFKSLSLDMINFRK